MNIWLSRLAVLFQAVCVLVLVQSLVVKSMATPAEVAVFQKLEMNSTGRITSIIVEVLCITGMVTSRLSMQGTVLTILVFSIGVFFQLTELEINWWNDGGMRFYLNVIGLCCAIAVFSIRNYLSASMFRRGRG